MPSYLWNNLWEREEVAERVRIELSKRVPWDYPARKPKVCRMHGEVAMTRRRPRIYSFSCDEPFEFDEDDWMDTYYYAVKELRSMCPDKSKRRIPTTGKYDRMLVVRGLSFSDLIKSIQKHFPTGGVSGVVKDLGFPMTHSTSRMVRRTAKSFGVKYDRASVMGKVSAARWAKRAAV